MLLRWLAAGPSYCCKPTRPASGAFSAAVAGRKITQRLKTPHLPLCVVHMPPVAALLLGVGDHRQVVANAHPLKPHHWDPLSCVKRPSRTRGPPTPWVLRHFPGIMPSSA